MAHLKRTTSADADFQSLVALLDADLRIRDGEDHAFYAQFNKIDALRQTVVGYEASMPVATGAFKEFDTHTVEIKRMYVLPEFRGQGIAQQVLAELEHWAAENNYTRCVLETGKQQPEAIRLYQKAGYTVIANYGQYAGVENSVCMEKQL